MRIAMLALWLMMVSAVPAMAQQAPDADAFTTVMATRLSAAIPARKVRVAGPLELAVSPAVAGEEDAHLYLDRIHGFCRTATADACEGVKARFVAGTVESMGEVPPVTRDRLRIVVRNPGYCRQLDAMFSESGDVGVTRPLAPGLCAVLVADYPNTTRILRLSDLDRLGMTPVAAWERARGQTLAHLPGVDAEIDPSEHPILVTDMDYVPSLMLDHDGWQRLAARLGRPLIVMVPADNLLVIDLLDRVQDLDGLRGYLRRAMLEAERGVSPEIYRWNGDGWVVVR